MTLDDIHEMNTVALELHTAKVKQKPLVIRMFVFLGGILFSPNRI